MVSDPSPSRSTKTQPFNLEKKIAGVVSLVREQEMIRTPHVENGFGESCGPSQNKVGIFRSTLPVPNHAVPNSLVSSDLWMGEHRESLAIAPEMIAVREVYLEFPSWGRKMRTPPNALSMDRPMQTTYGPGFLLRNRPVKDVPLQFFRYHRRHWEGHNIVTAPAVKLQREKIA